MEYIGEHFQNKSTTRNTQIYTEGPEILKSEANSTHKQNNM